MKQIVGGNPGVVATLLLRSARVSELNEFYGQACIFNFNFEKKPSQASPKT
jgi:hypothetical protein